MSVALAVPTTVPRQLLTPPSAVLQTNHSDSILTRWLRSEPIFPVRQLRCSTTGAPACSHISKSALYQLWEIYRLRIDPPFFSSAAALCSAKVFSLAPPPPYTSLNVEAKSLRTNATTFCALGRCVGNLQTYLVGRNVK